MKNLGSKILNLPFQTAVFAVIALDRLIALPSNVKAILRLVRAGQFLSMALLTNLVNLAVIAAFAMITVLLLKSGGVRTKMMNRLFYVVVAQALVQLVGTILGSWSDEALTYSAIALVQHVFYLIFGIVLVRHYDKNHHTMKTPSGALLAPAFYFGVFAVAIFFSFIYSPAKPFFHLVWDGFLSLIVPTLWMVQFLPAMPQKLREIRKALSSVLQILLGAILGISLLAGAWALIQNIDFPDSATGYYYDANGNGKEDPGEYAYTQYADGTTHWDVDHDGKVDVQIDSDGSVSGL